MLPVCLSRYPSQKQVVEGRTIDTRTASSLSDDVVRLNDDIKHQDGSCKPLRMFMHLQRREALRGMLCNHHLVVNQVL
jgi:hypothetical protein